jgi:predicted TIM-barrel fold metal-dependent hydrolase
MKHIDCHNHFFNIQFALREVCVIVWHLLNRNYPFDGDSHALLPSAGLQNRLWHLRAFIKELAYASTGDCLYHHCFHQKSYRNAGISGEEEIIAVVPLMMDIYYIIDEGPKSLPQPVSDVDTGPEESQATVIAEYAAQMSQFKDDVLRDLRLSAFRDIAARHDEFDESQVEYNFTYEFNSIVNTAIQGVSEDPRGFGLVEGLTWGFYEYMKDLEQLQEKNKGCVFPFFAVDPRRKNIMNVVEQKVGEDKPFKGIKIYPALGYYPSHPNLEAVYDFCLEFGIPICVHASDGGFPSRAERIYTQSWCGNLEEIVEPEDPSDKRYYSRHFGKPELWTDILKYRGSRYKDLRINFAHFGYMNDTPTLGESLWTAQIIDLMEESRNIYTDLSDRSDLSVDDIVEFLQSEENQVANERVMFGTDYPIMMLNLQAVRLVDFFNKFEGLSENMFYHNARRFLGLEPSGTVCTRYADRCVE